MKVHVHDDVHQASENLKLRFWRAANRCQFLTFQLAVKGDVDLTQNEMPEWTWKRRRPRSAKLQQCQTIKVSVREWKKFCTTCRKLATSIIQTDSVSIQKILQVTSISLFPFIHFISSYWLHLLSLYHHYTHFWKPRHRSAKVDTALPCHTPLSGGVVGNDHFMGPRALKTPSSYIHLCMKTPSKSWIRR